MSSATELREVQGEIIRPGDLLEVPLVLRSFPDFVAAWNQRQGLGTPDLHITISAWLEERRQAADHHLLLMVFRDAGKSTLVGLYSAWLLMRDPDLRILVLSADHLLACKMTRNVRRVIERHPWTGHLKPKRAEQWAADQVTVERNLNLRDPSLLARGVSSNITGSRADVVICDDVEVPNTCDTTQKRIDLRERLSEIAYVLVPGGTQLYVGTPHTYYSVYADVARQELGETAPFLDGFTRLVLPIINASGKSRWPERFSESHIARLRRTTGPTKFASQMMLRPAHAREVRLDPAKLVAYEGEIETRLANGRAELRIAGRRMIASAAWWDPAFGRPRQGDGSVVAVLFIDEGRDYWLHAMRYITVTEASGRAAALQQCAAVVDVLRANEQPSITVETNGIGRFLPDLLRDELVSAGYAASVVDHATTTPKDRRILEAFDALIDARRLRVHRSVLDTPFIEEMREWQPGGGSRDDGLDAVSGCILSRPLPIGTRAAAGPRARPDWRGMSGTIIADTSFPV